MSKRKFTWSTHFGLPPVCRRDGCSIKVRSDNMSGYCKIHRNYAGTCANCLKVCKTESTLCSSCNSKDKRDGSSTYICFHDGCNRKVRSKSGFCREHWLMGPQCEATTRPYGHRCENLTSKTAKYPFCRKHISSARKFRPD